MAIESIRLTRQIVAQQQLRRYRPRELKPGPDRQSDEDLPRAIQEIATTILSPAGMVKIVSELDPMAVLDERLRVRGVGSLRAVDVFANPIITSGNTHAPCGAIGERASTITLADV